MLPYSTSNETENPFDSLIKIYAESDLTVRLFPWQSRHPLLSEASHLPSNHLCFSSCIFITISCHITNQNSLLMSHITTMESIEHCKGLQIPQISWSTYPRCPHSRLCPSPTLLQPHRPSGRFLKTSTFSHFRATLEYFLCPYFHLRPLSTQSLLVIHLLYNYLFKSLSFWKSFLSEVPSSYHHEIES